MSGVLSDSISSAHVAKGGKGGTEKSTEHGGRASVLGVNCPDDSRRDHGEFAKKQTVHDYLWSTYVRFQFLFVTPRLLPSVMRS